MKTYPIIINGEAITEGETFDVVNPSTGKPFARSVRANSDHLNMAVEAAKSAFPSWSATSSEDRTQMLHALGGLLEQNMPQFMELISLETGKPPQGLNDVGAGMEVGGAIAWSHVTADFEVPVEIVSDEEDVRIEIHHKPLGVVGSITPWNWPLTIAIWHIIPALRMGNTVVIKPSPFTPVATSEFVKLANTVLPAGVLNFVSGGPELGAQMVEHDDIAKVVFTGSTRTGKTIMRSSAGNLKRLTLELGGNDAAIVLDDIDIQAVAPKLVQAIFHNNGQTCAALKRLYVPSSIYDELCEAMVDYLKDIKVGDGTDVSSQLGPVQNVRQFQIVQEFYDSAIQDGGRVLCGGKVMDREGYFFEPTLVADLSDGTKLVDEEPFGPIAPVIKYDDLEDVIRRANDNPSGLGGSVWSSDISRAAEIAQRLECGTAWVNDHGSIRPDAPFGGVKQSGVGVEHGTYGLKEFSSIQTVMIPK